MKKIFAICLMCLVSSANASWQQLPEALGWNVGFDYITSQNPMADNWQAATTAAVTDIRFWVSWYNDEVSTISLHVTIQEDVPPDPLAGNPSRPGNILWSKDIAVDSVEMNFYGTGDEGFFVPFSDFSPISIEHNSDNIYQIEISDIQNPFVQEAGKIYWLSISAWYFPGEDYCQPGWLTSANHSLPGAAYVDGGWLPLGYPFDNPRFGEPIDLAFEIIPEPATICLLGLGALSLIRRKNKRKLLIF